MSNRYFTMFNYLAHSQDEISHRVSTDSQLLKLLTFADLIAMKIADFLLTFTIINFTKNYDPQTKHYFSKRYYWV